MKKQRHPTKKTWWRGCKRIWRKKDRGWCAFWLAAGLTNPRLAGIPQKGKFIAFLAGEGVYF